LTETDETGAAGRGTAWPPAAWLWRSLGLPFLFVYVVGLSSEVGAFWRLDGSTATLCAAAFPAFGLLATLCFGFVRALPAWADQEAEIGLRAGKRSFHAAILALAGLVVVHGWSEAWPGMALLARVPITALLVRALFVALGIGAASSGLLAIWHIDELLTRPVPRAP
jgi:hypothetical protein